MSIKLQAKLVDSFSSHMELSYLYTRDIMIINGFHAEMTFQQRQGFMEHESQRNDYLPCFHLQGEITEIRGNFPYHVSALYFDSSDQQRMIRDIFYYPSPEELAHLIKTGKYYSRYFRIPPILDSNTYSFPCVVNLAIVPPPDPGAYEIASLGNFLNLEDEEKVNLPIFYVGVVGTGITRKVDKLLDYYGIDVDENFPGFALTAESSGYTDPPLLAYMDAPDMSDDAGKDNPVRRFLSPEEADELLRTREEERHTQNTQEQASTLADVEQKFHPASMEDAIIAKADRAVFRRLESKFGDTRRLSLDAKREYDRMMRRAETEKNAAVTAEQETDEQAQTESSKEKREVHHTDSPAKDGGFPQYDPTDFISDDDGLEKRVQSDLPEQYIAGKMDLHPEKNLYVRNEREEQSGLLSDGASNERTRQRAVELAGGDVSDARDQALVDEAHTREIAKDAAIQQNRQSIEADTNEADTKKQSGKRNHPDMPERYTEVKMDFEPEKNMDVQNEREERSVLFFDGVSNERTRQRAVELAGCDVSNAQDQVLVEEARTREIAKDAAVSAQRKRHDTSVDANDAAEKKSDSDDFGFG